MPKTAKAKKKVAKTKAKPISKQKAKAKPISKPKIKVAVSSQKKSTKDQ